MNEKNDIYCSFCGTSIGGISERTFEKVKALYYCPECIMNYCNECSYEKKVNGESKQFCLRCDSNLDLVESE